MLEIIIPSPIQYRHNILRPWFSQSGDQCFHDPFKRFMCSHFESWKGFHCMVSHVQLSVLLNRSNQLPYHKIRHVCGTMTTNLFFFMILAFMYAPTCLSNWVHALSDEQTVIKNHPVQRLFLNWGLKLSWKRKPLINDDPFFSNRVFSIK